MCEVETLPDVTHCAAVEFYRDGQFAIPPVSFGFI
jgi:hypothetical protein